MPYKLPRHRRASVRTRHHGNWRAVLVQYAFSCASHSNGGEIPFDCSGIENLELHEPFGEVKPHQLPLVQGRMQSRVLLCLWCHMRAHDYGFPYTGRGHASMILEDAEEEIKECGGYDKWLLKYGLTTLR